MDGQAGKTFVAGEVEIRNRKSAGEVSCDFKVTIQSRIFQEMRSDGRDQHPKPRTIEPDQAKDQQAEDDPAADFPASLRTWIGNGA